MNCLGGEWTIGHFKNIHRDSMTPWMQRAEGRAVDEAISKKLAGPYFIQLKIRVYDGLSR